MSLRSWSLCALLLVAACDLRLPHAVLTVTDPGSLCASAATLAVGTQASSLATTAMKGKSFPTTVALTADQPDSTLELWVEARDAQGLALARGRVSITFPKGRAGNAEVALSRPCATDSECDDSVYCNGSESCAFTDGVGFCLRGAAPCSSSPYDCVTVTCVELAKGCDTKIDHTRCPIDQGETHYCDPGRGCMAGKPCLTPADCQDGLLCDGEERCEGNHCVPGIPLTVDDGDPCTVDLCLEPTGRKNFPDPSLDGTPCTLAGPAESRICVAGACSPSKCGDGFWDQRTEACEDGLDNPNDGCDVCRLTSWTWSARSAVGPGGGQPLAQRFGMPRRLAVDRRGNVYLPDYDQHRVWRVDHATGRAISVAGNGTMGFSGDGGPASEAQLFMPTGVDVDGLGNLYVADGLNTRIRVVDARSGLIHTVAGGGASDDEGIPATERDLGDVEDVAVDPAGNVYLVDYGHNRILRVDAASGLIHTVAGTGADASSGDGGKATLAAVKEPKAVTVASASVIFVVEDASVRRITLSDPADATSGVIKTVAGNGKFTGADGDGVPALNVSTYSTQDVAVEADGSLLLTAPEGVRRVVFANRSDPRSGVISTVAGNGKPGRPTEGALALQSPLTPDGIVLAPDGALLVTEDDASSVQRIERPSSDPLTWTIHTLAGGKQSVEVLSAGLPTTAAFDNTAGLAATDRWIYFSDDQREVIWAIHLADPEDPLTWKLAPVAGGGTLTADGVPALQAKIPMEYVGAALAVDATGALYVGSRASHQVRRITFDRANPWLGTIDTIAGDGHDGDGGDEGPSLTAQLSDVTALAFDGEGRLFIASGLSRRVRFVTFADAAKPSTWTIHRAAGTGLEGNEGDDGLARAATLDFPSALAAADGYLFVADAVSHVIRGVKMTGGAEAWTIFTVAGDGFIGTTGDGGPATKATLVTPTGLAFDPVARALLIADGWDGRVRQVSMPAGSDPSTWIIDAYSNPGSATDPFNGEGQTIGVAGMLQPTDLARGTDGTLFLAGIGVLRRVRFGTPGDAKTTVVDTILGPVDAPGDGPFDNGVLGVPHALVRLDADRFAIADGTGGRVRLADLAKNQLRTLAGHPDGLPVTAAAPARYAPFFQDASGLAYDPQTLSLFVADRGRHTIERLRLVDPLRPTTWTLEPFCGQEGKSGHVDGPLAKSLFSGPAGMVFDEATRTLYVAEAEGHVVRALLVDAPDDSKCVTTYAGSAGQRGDFGEGVAAKSALFNGPEALALSVTGLYVADTGNHKVRRIDRATGVIELVLGDGTAASSGTGSPARLLPVDSPRGLALDGYGNLFVTSRTAIRVVTPGKSGEAKGDGTVRTIFGASPREQFPDSVTNCLSGIGLLPGDANLVALDACQGFMIGLDRAP